MKTTESSETCDAILGGKVRVIQPRGGYRFSIDSILLARFVAVRGDDRVLDLGAGSGVISLVIAALQKPREIVALEVQRELVDLIRRNAELNCVDSILAITADLRDPNDAKLPRETFDVVVANPPYRASAAGRESPQGARRIARSESSATLDHFVAAAAWFARRGGKAAFVFAADRSAELISGLRGHRLEPKRIRSFICRRPGENDSARGPQARRHRSGHRSAPDRVRRTGSLLARSSRDPPRSCLAGAR
jgi:tRNA1Val (adenine37-N6)-methyltransferase